MLAQLRCNFCRMAPLERRDGDPFKTAAIDEQCRCHHDQAQPDPNGPPVLLADQLAPERLARGDGGVTELCDMGHGRSLRQALRLAAPPPTVDWQVDMTYCAAAICDDMH